MRYLVFLFDTQLQSTYSAEQYNRQQLAYLADAHRREWLERINAKIASLMAWTTTQERVLRDMYIALRKLVNNAQAA